MEYETRGSLKRGIAAAFDSHGLKPGMEVFNPMTGVNRSDPARPTPDQCCASAFDPLKIVWTVAGGHNAILGAWAYRRDGKRN